MLCALAFIVRAMPLMRTWSTAGAVGRAILYNAISTGWNTRMKKATALCLATLLMACLLGSTAIGAKEPLTVLSAEQLEKLLEQSRGKVVMLNFFASWCPPCREEIPSLVELRKRYSPEQVVFIGISVDEKMDDLKKFVADTPFNYPIYLADPRVAYTYNVQSIPHNTVYNKAGKLVANQPGMIEERDLRQALDGLVREK